MNLEDWINYRMKVTGCSVEDIIQDMMLHTVSLCGYLKHNNNQFKGFNCTYGLKGRVWEITTKEVSVQ